MTDGNLEPKPVILIISSKRDGHISWVSRYIDAANHRWVRINTEDFSKNVELSVNPVSGTGSVLILDSQQHFNLEDVSAVWYRKPDPFDLSHFSLDAPSLEYIEAEFNELLQGIYALQKDVLWINNPLTSRVTHRKMLQLKIADSVGFITPRTLVTNRIEDALRFAEEVNWDLAVKSLGTISVTKSQNDADIQYGIFTRRIGKDEILALKDKIPYMPTLFQAYVEKEYELRITCVGQKVFACKIDSQSNDLTKEDMRFDTQNLGHEICQFPEIEYKLLAYLEKCNLNFGCFDFAFSKNGEFVFFECNPNGQWLWIEELTNAPISEAVANLLMQSGTA